MGGFPLEPNRSSVLADKLGGPITSQPHKYKSRANIRVLSAGSSPQGTHKYYSPPQ